MNEPISLEYYNSLSEEQKDKLFRNWKQQGIITYKSDTNLWDNNDSNRATGRTTRLVDYYIQELFNHPNEEIKIVDHTNTQQSNIHLTQMILRRIYEEHRGVKIKVIKQNVLKYVRM